jgi:hypothetical protein
VNQENGIRQRNISRGRRLLLAFTCSTGLLDPCRPSAVDEGLPFITHVLLVAISIAMTHGLGHAQAPVASQEAILSSSTITHDGAGDNQSTSIHGPSDQVSASPCRLQVQATRHISPISGERHRSYDDDRNLGLHPLARTL